MAVMPPIFRSNWFSQIDHTYIGNFICCSSTKYKLLRGFGRAYGYSFNDLMEQPNDLFLLYK
ncbi:hypothetical protein SRABI134_02314 [Peribacillus sp. Bi134]|nr:hypothetical protein SRABI134_02314 [Peribacillus sp. Bi134]